MGLLSYLGIKIKTKPKNKTTKEEIQALKEAHKKLMEGIQTDKDNFFDADKFACTQEVFDLIRKLPNFMPADPRVPESGYLNGKPIFVHPACAPNTIMGLKNQGEPTPEVAYMHPIDFQANPKNPTGFYGDTPYEAKDYRKIRVRNKPNMYKIIKVLAGIIIPLIVGAILFALLII